MCEFSICFASVQKSILISFNRVDVNCGPQAEILWAAKSCQFGKRGIICFIQVGAENLPLFKVLRNGQAVPFIQVVGVILCFD